MAVLDGGVDVMAPVETDSALGEIGSEGLVDRTGRHHAGKRGIASGGSARREGRSRHDREQAQHKQDGSWAGQHDFSFPKAALMREAGSETSRRKGDG